MAAEEKDMGMPTKEETVDAILSAGIFPNGLRKQKDIREIALSATKDGLYYAVAAYGDSTDKS
jgi:hypothetical protein